MIFGNFAFETCFRKIDNKIKIKYLKYNKTKKLIINVNSKFNNFDSVLLEWNFPRIKNNKSNIKKKILNNIFYEITKYNKKIFAKKNK